MNDGIRQHFGQYSPPALTFGLGGLNYFAEANLLFGGKQAFKALSGPAYVPWDLLAVGDITDPS